VLVFSPKLKWRVKNSATVFLFFITLISLFTVLNIEYGSFRIVFILYEAILAITGIILTIIWVIAMKTKSIHGETSPSLVKPFLLNSITPPIVFVIAIGISFLNLDIAQYFWLAIFPCRILISKRYASQT
jgi:hypothetical protein